MPDTNGHSHYYGGTIWGDWSSYRQRFDRTDCVISTLPAKETTLVMFARWMLGKSKEDSLKQYRQALLNKDYNEHHLYLQCRLETRDPNRH